MQMRFGNSIDDYGIWGRSVSSETTDVSSGIDCAAATCRWTFHISCPKNESQYQGRRFDEIMVTVPT